MATKAKRKRATKAGGKKRGPESGSIAQILVLYLNGIRRAVKEGPDALVKAIEAQTLDTGKWQAIQTKAIKDGFKLVAAAIDKLQQPAPPTAQLEGGRLVARYRVPADSPDITFDLVGRDFLDSEGKRTDAKNIDLSLSITNPEAVSATIGTQALSADGKSVTAPVTVHFESESIDMGVVAYAASNRKTGAVVAADSDEFIVGPGEASIGTLDSDVPLDAEEEPAPGPVAARKKKR